MIYFICAGKRVKIGRSVNVGDRLSALQTGSAEPLRLLAVCLGEKPEEEAYHKRFAKHRENGEWFRITKPLLDHLSTFGPAADRKLLNRLRRVPAGVVPEGTVVEHSGEDDGPAVVVPATAAEACGGPAACARGV